MKTTIENIITSITTVFTSTPTKNELMPQLIPVRVITNRVPGGNNH